MIYKKLASAYKMWYWHDSNGRSAKSHVSLAHDLYLTYGGLFFPCHMDKPKEGEILGPKQHEYNRPGLSPKEFLYATFQDDSLPMSVRIDAAKAVAVYEHPRLAQVNQNIEGGMTIRIQGGLPALPGTNIIMPESEEVPIKTNGSGQP